MEKDSISQISGLAVAAVNKIQSDFNIAVVPEGFKVVGVEQFNRYKNRFTGNFNTASFIDYVAYCKKYSCKNAEHDDDNPALCFIDSEELSAKAIFDLGTLDFPQHGKHNALLQMEKTPAFKALLEINGKAKSQRDIAEFLEDWHHNIVAFGDDGEEMTVKKAVAAVRKITIEAARKSEHEEGNMNASRSIMENVEASSSKGLPHTILFTCRPYEGLSQRDVGLEISIITSDDRPMLKLRIMQLEALKEDVAQEFKNALISAFEKTDVETFIGKFSV